MKHDHETKPLFLLISKVAELAWINLLTILFCIPVVTIYPALCTMYTLLLPRDSKNAVNGITRTYWRVFRRLIREQLLIMIVVPVLFLLLAGNLFISAFLMPQSTLLWYVCIALYSTLLILLTGASLYLPASLVVFQTSRKDLLRNSLVLSLKSVPQVMLMNLLSVAPLGILFLNPQISIRLFPFLLFFGLSIPAWMNNRIMMKQLRNCIPDLEVPAP